MKNKMMGFTNILFGFIGVLVQISMLLIHPRLLDMYKDLSVQPPLITNILPFMSIFILGLMLVVIYVGFKLLNIKDKNDKLFTKGIICLIVTIILNVFFIGIFYVLNAFNPIRTLTPQ